MMSFFFSRCTDCCKVCCCEDGGESGYRIATNKSKRQCEEAGGIVIPCPGFDCPCECTPSVTIKGIPIAWDQDGFLEGVPRTFLGAEPTADPVCDGSDGTEWQFEAAFRYSCEYLGAPNIHYLRVIVWASLWYVYANGVKANVSAPFGQDYFGEYIWDYFFTKTSPLGSGWPCPLDVPELQFDSGWSIQNPSTFGCIVDPNWQQEFLQLSESYLNPIVSLTCEPYTATCEGPA